MSKKKSSKDPIKQKEELLEKEIEVMDKSDYGIKEFIHGMTIGIVLGFILAWFML